MTVPARSYRNPYTPTPGSSTPGPEVSPSEGKAELWLFFWVTVASIAIIAAGGIAAWVYAGH
ncbi:MAG: hypothetical protein ACREDE_00375 [Thermoplasmata archaeon]